MCSAEGLHTLDHKREWRILPARRSLQVPIPAKPVSQRHGWIP
jgi:hypothetical protein